MFKRCSVTGQFQFDSYIFLKLKLQANWCQTMSACGRILNTIQEHEKRADFHNVTGMVLYVLHTYPCTESGC